MPTRLVPTRNQPISICQSSPSRLTPLGKAPSSLQLCSPPRLLLLSSIAFRRLLVGGPLLFQFGFLPQSLFHPCLTPSTFLPPLRLLAPLICIFDCLIWLLRAPSIYLFYTPYACCTMSPTSPSLGLSFRQLCDLLSSISRTQCLCYP